MGSTARATAAVLVAALLLPLSGCLPATPSVIPTAAATSAPVFANDEEALAAAIEAYEKYLAVSDAVGNGGQDVESLAPLVTAENLVLETDSYRELASTGNRLTGTTTYSSFTAQSLTQSMGRVEFTAYVCLDVSASRLLDEANVDITPEGRRDLFPLEVGFENEQPGSRTLLIARSEPWPGQDFC